MRGLALVVALAGCSESPTSTDLAALSDLAASADLAALSDLAASADLAVASRAVVYVSGYSPQIARFDFDLASGALTPIDTLAVSGNPSFLAVDPARRHLYALDENSPGSVRAFTIDQSGALGPVGSAVFSGGNGPAHLSVDPSGKYLLVANYGDGTVSVLPIAADGSLGAASDTRSAGANAHMMLADESSAHVFVPCKGANDIAQYSFSNGQLSPNTPATVDAPTAGAGPRHILLRPGFAYVIEENDSHMTAYTRDASGRLSFLQSLSTLPAGFSGTSTGAEVAAHGSFLYGSNRGDDSLVQYSLGADGQMTLVGFTKTGGKTPRHFSVSGDWLLVANQDSNEVRVFALDPTSGVPLPTTVRVSVPSPSFVAAVVVP